VRGGAHLVLVEAELVDEEIRWLCSSLRLSLLEKL
jgi:hypothetical protein